MTDLRNKSEVIGDLISLKIGATPDDGEYMATVDLDWGYDAKPIMTTETGTNPIKHLVSGMRLKLVITFQQVSDALKQRLMGLGAPPSLVLAPGASLPATKLRFHDPQAGATTGDVVIEEAVFMGLRRVTDGAGEQQLVAEVGFQVAANGRVGSLGVVA